MHTVPYGSQRDCAVEEKAASGEARLIASRSNGSFMEDN
jgi:hypothetical protein